MKTVLDTNVFVSSFFGGNPRAVINLWRDGIVTLCLSNDILEEYLEVLTRLGLAGRPEFDGLLNLLQTSRNLLFVAKPDQRRAVPADPDDDKFIACAVALGARYIVSGDKHLLGMRRYMGIGIMTPAQFVKLAQETGRSPTA